MAKKLKKHGVALQKVEYRLVYDHPIQMQEAKLLRDRISQILAQEDLGALKLLFTSSGGSTAVSLSLYNYIAQLPIPISMHAMGLVESSASIVFLAASTRTCSPSSRFGFHEYSYTLNGAQTLNTLSEAINGLRSEIDVARGIIQSRTKAGDDILNALDGTAPTALVDAQRAVEIGLVESVGEIQNGAENGMAVVVWTC